MNEPRGGAWAGEAGSAVVEFVLVSAVAVVLAASRATCTEPAAVGAGVTSMVKV